MTIEPVKTGKLYEHVAEQLENKILCGDIEVGDHLPAESKLAEMFNVGKRSVREALQVLETKGLVKRQHGERTKVVRNDMDLFITSLAQNIKQLRSKNQEYYSQLVQARSIIEAEAAAIISANIPDYDLRGIQDALQIMREAEKKSDIELMIRGDALFHTSLVNALENEFLSVFYKTLFKQLQEEISVAIQMDGKTIKIAYEEHQGIYRYLVSGEVDQVKKAIQRQMEQNMVYLERFINEVNKKTTD